MSYTISLIQSYYKAFNAGDREQMLSLLADNVVHEPSQGKARQGREAFAAFLSHMDQCYAEQVIAPVVMTNGDGSRAAAEFQLAGRYTQTDVGLPEAAGQEYRLRVGTFFEIDNGKITRVSNHYNLADWIDQVSQ